MQLNVLEWVQSDKKKGSMGLLQVAEVNELPISHFMRSKCWIQKKSITTHQHLWKQQGSVRMQFQESNSAFSTICFRLLLDLSKLHINFVVMILTAVQAYASVAVASRTIHDKLSSSLFWSKATWMQHRNSIQLFLYTVHQSKSIRTNLKPNKLLKSCSETAQQLKTYEHSKHNQIRVVDRLQMYLSTF